MLKVSFKIVSGLGVLFLMLAVSLLPAFPGNSAAPKDNYPSRWKDPAAGTVIDDWGLYNRNCTSWVAWALHDRNGFEIPRNFGNADAWGNKARSLGYAVDNNPQKGSVAWWNKDAGQGANGHVAWVETFTGTSVTVQEYNYPLGSGNYYRRTVPKNTISGFIHFKDLSADNNSGYFNGIPGDGYVVRNYDDDHRYVAAGGSLFEYDRANAALDADFVNQMRVLYGAEAQPLKMLSGEIQTLESKKPDNDIFLRERGSANIYQILFAKAFHITSIEELNYLNGNGQDVLVPPGSISPLETASQPAIPGGTILRTMGLDDPDYEAQGDKAYWANNYTVQECIQKVKGGGVQLVPASLAQKLDYTKQPSQCGFPSYWAIHEPGSQQRWYIYGQNPYNRYLYSSPFALHCILGEVPAQVQITAGSLNQIVQSGQNMYCPDNSYVRNQQTGQIYRVLDDKLHYVQSMAVLSCLVGGTPGIPTAISPSILDTVPRGPDAHCNFEGKLIQSPGGQIYWIKDGQRRYVGNATILYCIKVRAATGNQIAVSQQLADIYQEGYSGYCPYPPEIRFVASQGRPEVWRVLPDGTRQHAMGLCSPSSDPRYRVWYVPAGETDGHRNIGYFYPSGAACAAIL